MSGVPLVVTAAITGGATPRYLSTQGFTSASTDTPASTSFLPRLRDTLTYGIEPTCWVWDGQGARGDDTDISLGVMEIDDTDGDLDSWLAENWRDLVVEIRRGPQDLDYDDLTLVAFAVIDTYEMEDAHTARVVLKHKGALLEVSAQQSVYGAIAEAPDLEGTQKPVVIGNCEGVPLIGVDDALLDYDLADAEVYAIDEVTDGGDILTQDVRWQASPAAGVFGVRRLDSPWGKQVAKVQGVFSEVSSSVLIERLPDVIEYLLGRSESQVDPGDVDPYAAVDLDAEAPYTLCRWWRDDSTFAQILTEAMDSFTGWWYFDRLGLLRVGRLEEADVSADPVLELSDVNIQGNVTPRLDRAGGLTDTIGAERNWSPYGPGETSPYMQATDPARYTRVTSEQQTRVGGSALHSTYRHAVGATAQKTLLSAAADAQTEADRVTAIYAEEKYFYDVTVLLGENESDLAFTLQPGDVVRLTFPRFGLDDGKNLIVVAVRSRLLSSKVDLVLWGEGPQAGDF